MCFGGKSSSQATPQPTAPTTFDYNTAQPDNSNNQRMKAMAASTTAPTSFGSELGGAAATPKPATGMMGGV